jgi:hypothetical protein
VKTTRHFFVSDNLDELERMEEELERAGMTTPQLHLLTLDDAQADSHRHLHTVVSLMKKDIVHQTIIGAVIGVGAAILALLIPYFAGWTDTAAGWVPFIFLAIVLLGFFTWEGGLRGIESPNVHFRAFQDALEQGRHVFFVDVEPRQENTLGEVARHYSRIEPAGKDRGAPYWLVCWQHRIKRFFVETFP